MTSMIRSAEILKTDVLGRVRTSPSRREELLDEFERSGLSGPKFAQMVGVKYQTLATWVQARRRQRGAYPKKTRHKTPPVRWLEAEIQRADNRPSKPSVVIEMPGIARMEVYSGTSTSMAAALLKLLQKVPRPC